MRVKLTSQRTGSVGWLRADNTPTNVITEAAEGLTSEQCEAMIAEYRANLVTVTGRCRCRWTFEIVPDPVVTWEVQTGSPSWHQRKAGHIAAATSVYSGEHAEGNARTYAANFRVHYPDQPCYVQRRRA